MDTPKHSHPPVMRPHEFGKHNSHVDHRPAVVPGRGKGIGLARLLGIGGTKVV
jgi:hypothetical protein